MGKSCQALKVCQNPSAGFTQLKWPVSRANKGLLATSMKRVGKIYGLMFELAAIPAQNPWHR